VGVIGVDLPMRHCEQSFVTGSHNLNLWSCVAHAIREWEVATGDTAIA